jgi:hypothetical protein
MSATFGVVIWLLFSVGGAWSEKGKHKYLRASSRHFALRWPCLLEFFVFQPLQKKDIQARYRRAKHVCVLHSLVLRPFRIPQGGAMLMAAATTTNPANAVRSPR